MEEDKWSYDLYDTGIQTITPTCHWLPFTVILEDYSFNNQDESYD